MIQVPSIQNPYRVNGAQQYIQNPVCNPQVAPQPDYNAVKIAINGASVQATPNVAPAPMADYAPVSMPYYSYPQADLYNYPQASQQPYYMPAQTLPAPSMAVLPQPAVAEQPAFVAPQPAVVAPQPVVQELPRVQPMVQPQVVQQNFNAPSVAVPEPVITQVAAQELHQPQETVQQPKVDIVAPEELKPQVDINAFIAELTNPDFEKQATAMENIAMMVNQDPQKATELLDERVVKSLTDILNTNTKELLGPSKEQLEAREKIIAGKEVSEAEKELANVMTPKEQAERNKSYSLFTLAIMQKLFGDEVQKLAGQVVPLSELPGSSAVVEQMKSNPNPMVRASAIEALSYIERPEYKNDLTAIFEVAKKDPDKNVQDSATAALAKLNKA